MTNGLHVAVPAPLVVNSPRMRLEKAIRALHIRTSGPFIKIWIEDDG